MRTIAGSRLAACGGLLCVTLVLSTVPTSGMAAVSDSSGLGLGAENLEESRTKQRLQPGVTLTSVERGHPDADDAWTVEVAIPTGDGTATIADQESADRARQRLEDEGFDARVERVDTARVADFGGDTLGYRVRVGRFADRAAADATLERMRASGFSGSSVFTGWDPDPQSTGPWSIKVLTVDPRILQGHVVGSYGPDLERRETTSTLARERAATAGVNAGFFVLDPAAGAPGDPAGVGVYGGAVDSEAVNGRPALVFDADGHDGDVVRLGWQGTVRGRGGSLPLDGVNRVPGLIRNCGGTRDDQPTAEPLHDITCTDPDEVVRFTSAYGAQTPSGPGVEAVLDRNGTVLALRSPRGGPVPPDGSTLQATGSAAGELRSLAPVGSSVEVSSQLTGEDGRALEPSASTYVLNGGPELVDDGRVQATPRTDGMVHPGEPSFYYAWAHKRNPRTLAGVDEAGRLVLATVDGRSTNSLGTSVAETAALARDLGMVEAVNLDGGGSTTMVARGQVVNHPSDSTGERPVGDALLVLPY